MTTTVSDTKVNQTSLENWLLNKLTEELKVDNIDVNESLTRYGLDSIDAVTLVGDLEDELDLELPDTLFWDHQSIAEASKFLIDNYDVSVDLENMNSASESENKEEKVESITDNKKKGGFFSKLMGA
jgi:acyl carrier protein